MTSAFTLELNASDCNLQSKQINLYAGGDRILWQSNTSRMEKRMCRLALLQNGILQIRDEVSSVVYWNRNSLGDSTVSWILKVNPDTGELSISDITNSTNMLWTEKGTSNPLLPAKADDRPIVWIVVGVLGQEVAAKVLSANSHQSKQEFHNEFELLSKVHHKYLVSLLGYSSTRKQQVLIYEYMGGGDLRHRLQGESGAGNPLSWRQRTSIILQVAEGLEYLHDKCSPPIIHRDIKSTNILLTNKLVAKVADFGLSKLKAIGEEDATHITTVVYHETGLLTEKSDVYAFGVVLMEVLTGRHHMHIAQRVGDAWRQEQFDGLADPNLGGDFNREELVSLVELALWCVRKRGQFMRQVVGRLHDVGLASSEPHQPEIELGDEGQRAAMNIELLTMDCENFASEVPLSDSSYGGMSFEVQYSPQLCSRSQRGR